ncbi:glycosyltransferase family 4 protein [Candidatus Uhrbacteria bacterium]|nr:glycosyltransferase family 4 protein [Candidatus Uhrbacteria bacterium]
MLGFQLIGAFLAVATASAILTGIVYRHAVARQWLAMPNTRSSHAVPTPSSGGIGLAIVALGVFAILGVTGALPASIALALVGGGALVAIIGWVDDRRQLPARVRIATHIIAAVWAVWWIGGPDTISLGTTAVPLGVWGVPLAVLAVVAFSNLYNFMDGIDGLIGTQAVLAGGILALLSFIGGASAIAASYGTLAAVAFGFLVWNWHPAKIFMGDVGSVLLGFSFAVLAVASERAQAVPALTWITIFAVVIVDAGFTTIRRALRGERWYEAHRMFSYQRAVQAGHRHSTVVLGVLALDVVLVLLAVAGLQRPTLLIPTTVTAIILAAAIWARYQFRPARPPA